MADDHEIGKFFPSQVENLLRKCMHLINLIGYAYYVSKVLLSLSTSNLISVRVCASYQKACIKNKTVSGVLNKLNTYI